MVEKINIDQKFSLFSEQWRPKVVAELNGQDVKVVKIQGEFPWHQHENEDEMFFVWRGQIRLEFRDRAVTLNEGEALVVPRGVEHRPVADSEAQILLFEPSNVRNTGNIVDETYTAPQGATV
ncbi:cupin domain-containing protein [Mesorhizobium sp. SB112]|uniref:cupin domain-containing protein n=1 Tax=Mesorhizobium sp. SB112 TaxID=3151853 RepID=UPI0032641C6B